MIDINELKINDILEYKMLADMGVYKYKVLRVSKGYNEILITCDVISASYEPSIGQKRIFNESDLEDKSFTKVIT